MLPEPSNAREAALVVHALGDEDREVLLSYLGEGERQRIAPLLAELEGLGIPRSFNVNAILARLKSEESATRPTAEHSTNVAYLQRQRAEVIQRVLRNQSPATISLLLNAHAWHWKHDVQAALAALIATAPTLHTATMASTKTVDAIVAAACKGCSEILLDAGNRIGPQRRAPLTRAFHDVSRRFKWKR